MPLYKGAEVCVPSVAFGGVLLAVLAIWGLGEKSAEVMVPICCARDWRLMDDTHWTEPESA